MTTIYTIEYITVDDRMQVGWWTNRAERDALWDAIQAIPWKSVPGYIGYTGWQEREVEFDRRGNSVPWRVTDHPEQFAVHGQLCRGDRTMAKGITVRDVTNRD